MKKRHRKHACWAVALAIMGMASTAAPESPSIESQVRLAKLASDGAQGIVGADRRYCRRHRKVILQKRQGDRYVWMDVVHTNRAGEWRADRDLSPGRYRAKVIVRPRAENKHYCRGDVSQLKRLRQG
jgi:hypothetical protein